MGGGRLRLQTDQADIVDAGHQTAGQHAVGITVANEGRRERADRQAGELHHPGRIRLSRSRAQGHRHVGQWQATCGIDHLGQQRGVGRHRVALRKQGRREAQRLPEHQTAPTLDGLIAGPGGADLDLPGGREHLLERTVRGCANARLDGTAHGDIDTGQRSAGRGIGDPPEHHRDIGCARQVDHPEITHLPGRQGHALDHVRRVALAGQSQSIAAGHQAGCLDPPIGTGQQRQIRPLLDRHRDRRQHRQGQRIAHPQHDAGFARVWRNRLSGQNPQGQRRQETVPLPTAIRRLRRTDRGAHLGEPGAAGRGQLQGQGRHRVEQHLGIDTAALLPDQRLALGIDHGADLKPCAVHLERQQNMSRHVGFGQGSGLPIAGSRIGHPRDQMIECPSDLGTLHHTRDPERYQSEAGVEQGRCHARCPTETAIGILARAQIGQ